MKRTITLLLLTAPGCAQLDAFLPKVSFDGLELRTLSWQEADVDFVFRIDNPNPVQVGLDSFSYDLELESISFLSGDRPDRFVLEPSDTSELRLPLDLVYADIWSTIQATRGEDLVDFGLSGRMDFVTPAGDLPIRFREDGDFPALRAPRFSIRALRIPSFTLSSADLELDIGVDNELGSTLFFDALDFDLSLNETPVASGLVQTFDVPGATEGLLTLPISVRLLDLGVTLFDALVASEPLDLGFGATVDVDTPFGVIPLSIDETGQLAAELL